MTRASFSRTLKLGAISAFLLAAFILALPAVALASGSGTISSEELIENSDRYNERKVRYRGEVVGDILRRRGGYAWIAVNDDPYGRRPTRRYAELKGGNTGLGVFCREEQLEDVEHLGSYREVGDLVEVEGTFYKASPEHGGDLCIVADHVEVILKGHRVNDARYGWEPLLAVALGLASLLVAALLYWQARSRPAA